MKTTKTTTTAFELEEGNRTVIGYSEGIFFVNTADGILQYNTEEMEECFDLNPDHVLNMKQVLSAGRRF